MPHASHEVTQLLIEWSNGDQAALDKLMPLVYDELRRIVRGYLARQGPGHSLQPTVLINEAFIKLVGNLEKKMGEPRAFLRRSRAGHAPHPGGCCNPHIAARRGYQLYTERAK